MDDDERTETVDEARSLEGRLVGEGLADGMVAGWTVSLVNFTFTSSQDNLSKQVRIDY